MNDENEKGRAAADADFDDRIAQALSLMEKALAILDQRQQGMAACYLSMAIESLERS